MVEVLAEARFEEDYSQLDMEVGNDLQQLEWQVIEQEIC